MLIFYSGECTSVYKQSYQIGLAPWVDHGSWEAELESFPPLVWTCDSDLEIHQSTHVTWAGYRSKNNDIHANMILEVQRQNHNYTI